MPQLSLRSPEETAPGYAIDGYAVDVHKDPSSGRGYLRLATIDWAREQGDGPVNELFVFEFPNGPNGGTRFERVGSVTMGKPWEEFESVWFLDDIAYAVTFEMTDPFYVLDLSIPERPAVLGELEVTGFSRYLHPVRNWTVVGVGQEADENGRNIGLQVSLFDVSDPVRPYLVDRVVVNETSISEAETDPRAFRFAPGAKGGGDSGPPRGALGGIRE